jgi:hypothetical protein
MDGTITTITRDNAGQIPACRKYKPGVWNLPAAPAFKHRLAPG